MSYQRESSATGPAKRKAEAFDEEKEKRAERKRIRTEWRTDATAQEKETSLRVAMNNIGGGKKYSWLQQGPVTVAETLGQKRAVELGKLAQELKIGEYRGDGPTHMEFHWEELRGAGINWTREEFANVLRESGMSEEEIQARSAPRPKKIVGRSAASVREQSGVVESAETTPPPTKPTKARGKKRAAPSDDSGAIKAPAKKRRTNTKKAARVPPTPPKSSPPPVIDLSAEDDTPPPEPESLTIEEMEAIAAGWASSKATDPVAEDNTPPPKPESLTIEEMEAIAAGWESSKATDPVAEDEDDLFAPPSPTIPELEEPVNNETPQYTSTIEELEALLDEELSSQSAPPVPEDVDDLFVPPSPTLPDLEESLDDEASECSATIEELEALLEDEMSSQSDAPSSEDSKLSFAPPSPSLSELEALLEDELE
ncbi:hypothetical protein F4678DRAFT_466972 [Xylaria arbuscula]|nr:hypothetical protein F4678DRAFT_466972 [Xylaria arbuscula]